MEWMEWPPPYASTKTQRRLGQKKKKKNNVWHDPSCCWPNPTKKPDHLPVVHQGCWGASSNGCLALGCEVEWKALSRGLHSPWNSAGQNTAVGSLSFLQGIFPTQGWNPGLPHCRWILYQPSHQGSPWRCVSRTTCSSVIALHGPFCGEVSPQLPETIIIVRILPVALWKDSGVSFSFSSVFPPPKMIDWTTKLISLLLMIRRAWRSSFQNTSHAVSTVGGDILLKVLHFSPKFPLNGNFPKFSPGRPSSLLLFSPFQPLSFFLISNFKLLILYWGTAN